MEGKMDLGPRPGGSLDLVKVIEEKKLVLYDYRYYGNYGKRCFLSLFLEIVIAVSLFSYIIFMPPHAF